MRLIFEFVSAIVFIPTPSGPALADLACIQSNLTKLGFDPEPADRQRAKQAELS